MMFTDAEKFESEFPGVPAGVLRMVESADEQFKSTAELLADEARRLSGAMAGLAVQAERAANGETYAINNLGEVQSRGVRVDVLCSRLSEQVKAMRQIRWLAGSLTESQDA